MKLKRKMKKTRDKADLVLGVGWYRENQWPILLQHVPVQEDLHRTYAEWLEEANERMDELVQAGIQAVKIPVDVHEMIRWCRVTKALRLTERADLLTWQC